jgi:predicted lipoprotein with Yx(FWY)xxD motif
MNKTNLTMPIILGAMTLTAIADSNEQGIKAPMMDGKCIEYQFLEKAKTTDIGSGIILYTFQDNDYVWFCYNKNKQSWGTLDLFIDSPGLDEALNLHVSAQLGEWPADKREKHEK